MEISETVRPRVWIRGISKIQTTAAQECRVGFHGKCRRYQREFSPSSDSLSLRARVRVAFADREIDVEGRAEGAEGGMEGAFCLSNQPYAM